MKNIHQVVMASHVYTPEGGFGESLKFWKWGDNIKEQMVD